jgi:hypothetical protein
MGSKKKSTKGILLSVGVWMMISYSTFGMKDNKPHIQSVLTIDMMHKVFNKDEMLKNIIENIKKTDICEVSDNGCCCWRDNVLGTHIKEKGGNRWTTVMALIYESLEFDIDNGVKMNDNLDNNSIQAQTGIYEYLFNNKLIALNNEIKKSKIRK